MAKISATRADRESTRNQNSPSFKKKRKKREEEKREEKKIIISSPIVKTNLLIPGVRRPNFGDPDKFDWSLYDDGWNGSGLKINKKIKVYKTDEAGNKVEEKVKVYCHEKYAQSDYSKYFGPHKSSFMFDDGVKDLVEGNVVKIKDVSLSKIKDKEGNVIGYSDELVVSTTTGGSAIINLAKENKFFETFGLSKEEGKAFLFSDEYKKKFIEDGYLAKIGRHGHASLYDGFLLKTQNEFMEQIALGMKANKAYIAHITDYNRGGFICNVQGLRCFLPASQAAANKVINFEDLVGTTTEVMIMRFIEGTGFIVSRKMYLAKVTPGKVEELKTDWKANPERIYRATVTGTQDFGVFLEINEFYTGLLHKMYVTEETARRIEFTNTWNKSLQPDPELPPIIPDPDTIPDGVIKPGDWFDVIIHNITDDNRIVFTNILDPNERKAVIEVREKEKAEYDAKRAAEDKAERAAALAVKLKESKAETKTSFKGQSISFEDLKKKLNLKK